LVEKLKTRRSALFWVKLHAEKRTSASGHRHAIHAGDRVRRQYGV
jgi:hypothetical protein